MTDAYNRAIHIAAGADFSGATGQYRALAAGGTLATDAVYGAIGILQNKPQSGEDAAIVYDGRSKFQAGGAITALQRVMVSSGGFMVAASSGDTSCGFSELAVSSGAFGHGVFNFATLMYHVSSAG